MVRVKRGIISLKRRRSILKAAKGFHWGAKSKERLARERLLHAGMHAFYDRRKKKGDFRRLWNIKINAASREYGKMSYSAFMHRLKMSGVTLNRKILAEIAEKKPDMFAKIVQSIK